MRRGPGLFVTVEGGEGSGKSTQIRRLVARWRRAGHEVVTTREPGGTPLGEGVRELLLDPSLAPDGISELFLLSAARHDHVRSLIRPALERGAVVVCDRYADSSTVYQGLVRGVPAETVRELTRLATGGLEPDRTIVLDLPPEEALARARSRNARDEECSRIDDEPLGFHRRVRDGFLTVAERAPERVRVVDATGSEEQVAERVLAALPERWR